MITNLRDHMMKHHKGMKLILTYTKIYYKFMKGGQWQIRGEIRRHTREIFVSFCRELLVQKKFSCNLKEFRLFSMSARCKQEIFFWGKKILLYARNENFSSRPPPPLLMILFDGGIFKQEILIRCENFSCYARNEKISPRPRPQN